MSFAQCYLDRYKVESSFIKESPKDDLNIVVIVPCYNEPDVSPLLESLLICDHPQTSVEIIMVVNSSDTCPAEVKTCNKQTLEFINEWKETTKSVWFNLHAIDINNINDKDFGVGYARRVGMDEAIQRFGSVNNRKGVIVSLDADVFVTKNYLVEIENKFNEDDVDACSVYFEHPLSGREFHFEVYQAVANYELYLRYYIQSLRYIGFPNAYHTIGSCFAVRASEYVKQGGMNKKQAGEDFYFLHKIIPNGKFHELNATKVIPSPRPSSRVPFGTGPMVSKIVEEHRTTFLTYCFEAFLDLKMLFDRHKELYKPTKSSFDKLMTELPTPLVEFMEEAAFWRLLKEINGNCATLDSFSKKFFKAFNMLYVLRYLNHSHFENYSKSPVIDEALKLFERLSISAEGTVDVFSVLERIRKFENTKA